ncbi:MAG: replication-associated recombination protein A [Candidatus Paceibacterota bacterium]|jgi:putative ATPase|nr:replication-associated recombination protein A [Candidatus Paceibacterota bacterium]
MEIPKKTSSPLADRMRPAHLDEFLGQQSLVGKGTFLEKAIKSDTVPSLLFWGPPGTGKTTLARIIAKETRSDFLELSGVGSGLKDLRMVIEKAEENRAHGKKTILFIDEIHRWNKAQQDALLPHVEHGTVTLIGATTENPSFEVISALLSRSRVFTLSALSEENITELLERAITDTERGLGKKKLKVNADALAVMAGFSNGDARVALNTLEACAGSAKVITKKLVKEVLQTSRTLYDKTGEEHYNVISALHKSMRGGDANAAIYWLGRMLESGEEPLYIARRLIRFASEDIGIANSLALPQAVAAYQACHFIGMPECSVNLAQAVVYMAKSKKSNAIYTAYLSVQNDIRNFPSDPVPLHIRNAPTKLMKELGYGKGYKYTPKFENPKDAEQDYLPERIKGRKYLEE